MIPRIGNKVLSAWRQGGAAGVKRIILSNRVNLEQANQYQHWIEAFDEMNEGERRAIREHIKELPRQPLISVVLPVYNPPEQMLRRALDSVLLQLYPHWELCIADDASTEPHVRKVLDEYKQCDARIKVVYRTENGHISAASNSALELAEGEFVALMDHDDELPGHALYMVMVEVNEHPDADLIYSDEDKIDENGVRFDPYFKSDWNPDLFYSHNMISHLGVYRRVIVKEVGGFRAGYEGSQDYDLALRCIEKIPASHVRHIPRVLYHWRAIKGSTALAADEKSYAEVAARKSIQSHFDRTGSTGRITPGPAVGLHRARYPLPKQLPMVSVIIPTTNLRKVLESSLDDLFVKTVYDNVEILVVNSAGSDTQFLAHLAPKRVRERIKLLSYPGPLNYSELNNTAVRQSRGELMCFMHDDVEALDEAWLGEMVSQALRPEVGVVGAKLYYPDGTLQHAGIILGMGECGIAGRPHRGLPGQLFGYFSKAALIQNFSAVTATCMVMRRAVFNQVGGFDAEHLPAAYSDIDLCLRVQEQGYRVVWTPYAELCRHKASLDTDDVGKQGHLKSEVAYMKRRWRQRVARDPFYNPNLSLERGDFELAWPPRLGKPWALDEESSR